MDIMLKKLIITLGIIVIIGAGVFQGAKSWIRGMLPDKVYFQQLKRTQATDLPYVTENIPTYRGKILAVVTSTNSMGDNKATGYEHTELARAYWVFIANGFDVDIASPLGGKPPVVFDGEDMGKYDYAFINDKEAQEKINNSIALADIDPLDYQAVYFVGGKGTMFDFPDNRDIQRIAKTLYQTGRVVSAVCHGPAALVNVELDNGEMLLANKKVSGFTNKEELVLIPEAQEIFPFLLEDKLVERGANFQAGLSYLEQVSQDGKLITGQNPWSVWKMAEMVVEELGYQPKPRTKTPEENSVELLITYEKNGFEAAKAQLKRQHGPHQQVLLLMHSAIAFMQLDFTKGWDIINLAQELKNQLIVKSV